MKTKSYLVSMVCLALLSACGGGGNKLTDSTKSAGLSACEPSSGPAGTKVVCTVKGMTEDSTLFFDKKPIEYTLNETDGAVSFTVPASFSGEKNIYFQEGDSGTKPIGSFEVTSGTATGSDEVTPEGEGTTGGTTGDGGDVITPSGTGGTTTGGATTGSETPPDSDGDGVIDTSDACPGTAPGTTVDATGCPPAPPQPTNAQITEFTVTKAKSTDNSTGTDPYFSTYKIHWNFSNAKAAYLAGNIFNRASTDSALAASDQCKMVGDAPYNRYLVTAADGRPINPNLDENATSDNIKKKYKYYLEGVACGASGSATECKTGSYSQGAILPPKTYAFADDPMLLKSTYFYLPVTKLDDNIEVKKDLSSLIPMIPLVNEVNPKCRIDLKKGDGTAIASDTVFTISYVHYGNVCLAVQGNDDAWVVQCKSVTAPEAKVGTSNATLITSPKNALQVNFNYSNARFGVTAVAGCVKTGGTWSDSTGAGTYSGTCEVKNNTMDVNLAVTGMGEANSDKVTYHFEGGAPSIDFYWNGSNKTTPFMNTADCDQSGLPGKDCSGKVEFGYKVKNHYQLSRIDAEGTSTSVSSGDQPGLGAKEIRFYEGGDLKTTKAIASADDASGTIKMKRDHGHTTWKAAVYDTNSSKADEKSLSWDYWTSNADKDNPGVFFSMSGWEHLGCSADSYDDCCGGWDCDSECGVCVETEGPHQSGSIQWAGRHIKEVKSDCGMTIEQPSNDVYGYQHGKATGTWNNFDQTCNFTATAYDGSKLTWNNATWNCCK